MKKLVIDRSKWRTGQRGENASGDGITMLLNFEGYMCCLGFFCNASGIHREDLVGVGAPDELDKQFFSKIPLLISEVNIRSQFTDIAIEINDNEDMCREEREDQIRVHFASEGIKVEFINDYTNV